MPKAAYCVMIVLLTVLSLPCPQADEWRSPNEEYPVLGEPTAPPSSRSRPLPWEPWNTPPPPMCEALRPCWYHLTPRVRTVLCELDQTRDPTQGHWHWEQSIYYLEPE